jgi:K(+)-stimulated pyrophosphate-energized sodium pump
VGDTVGDPFKDTSSVAMNPVIKFTTLFGLLAANLAVSLTLKNTTLTHGLALGFFLISLFFVWRSFYKMRIVRSFEAVPAEDETKVTTAAR